MAALPLRQLAAPSFLRFPEGTIKKNSGNSCCMKGVQENILFLLLTLDSQPEGAELDTA